MGLIRAICWTAVIAVITATSISCHRRDPYIPKVDAGVRLFNGRFNAGRFHEIYANADSRFQRTISEDEFTTKLSRLLQEHGPIESSAMNGFDGMTRWQRLFPESKRTRFIGVYNHCKTGEFQEFFTFEIGNDEAKLLGFGTSIEELNIHQRH